MNLDQIAAEAAQNLRRLATDEFDWREIQEVIKAAIEKAVDDRERELVFSATAFAEAMHKHNSAREGSSGNASTPTKGAFTSRAGHASEDVIKRLQTVAYRLRQTQMGKGWTRREADADIIEHEIIPALSRATWSGGKLWLQLEGYDNIPENAIVSDRLGVLVPVVLRSGEIVFDKEAHKTKAEDTTSMTTDQIAAEAVGKIKGWMETDSDPWLAEEVEKVMEIIKAAIEKAHQDGMKYGWNEGREHERKSRASQDEWPEGYDLTSFLHGDKTRDQIAAEADEKIGKRLHDAGADCLFDFDDIIKAAIEKATTEQKKIADNWHQLFLQAMEPRAAQASETAVNVGRAIAGLPPQDEWSEDYDLTSFLHGDKTRAELIEANENLFKIARKYCMANKQIMDAERKEQARLIRERDGARDHMNTCRALLKVPNDEVLYVAIEELLNALAITRRDLLEANRKLAHASEPHERDSSYSSGHLQTETEGR